MSWLKKYANKALHGVIVAAGSVLPLIVTGAVAPVAGIKMAAGALVAYLLKPARPDAKDGDK